MGGCVKGDVCKGGCLYKGGGRKIKFGRCFKMFLTLGWLGGVVNLRFLYMSVY